MRFRWHSEAVVSLVASQQGDSSSPSSLGSFYVEFARYPRAYVGFLWALWFYPTDQKNLGVQ